MDGKYSLPGEPWQMSNNISPTRSVHVGILDRTAFFWRTSFHFIGTQDVRGKIQACMDVKSGMSHVHPVNLLSTALRYISTQALQSKVNQH